MPMHKSINGGLIPEQTMMFIQKSLVLLLCRHQQCLFLPRLGCSVQRYSECLA